MAHVMKADWRARIVEASLPILAAIVVTLSMAFLAPGSARAQQNLTLADVNQVVAQAAAEANARGAPAVIAVTDRVGNVLAVYRMPGAPATINITSGRPIGTGLDGLAGVVTAELGAIAKAVTGSYLASGGNAFTTRTASQIVQENFNPGEPFAPGGPLFGVQFSQLACSDLSRRFINNPPVVPPDQFRGPKRSPLGLSADPGGIPLYKAGVPVGAIGVIADGIYGLDAVVTDTDTSIDEIIALAGTAGFNAPINIRANRITVEGKTFRFTDQDERAIVTNPAVAPAPNPGNFVAVTGYFDGAPIAGTAYGTSASGIRPIQPGDGALLQQVSQIAHPNVTPFILVTGPDAPRFPIIPGAVTNGEQLTPQDVATILGHALRVAISGRAQIRRPLQSFIQVTVSVVDSQGAVLGQVRTPDGPIFGTDVSLQKARTAAFFSNASAGAFLQGRDLTRDTPTLNTLNALIPGHAYTIPDYVQRVRQFIGPTALADGTAFADRSGGNLSRPFYPDGVNGNGPGPFSRPLSQWSPFSTGLQLDLVVTDILNHLLFVLGLAPTDIPIGCTSVLTNAMLNPLANGIQIFPGSVPIFKNGVLVGGIGVSGDGVDQDDMVSFLGLHNAGVALGNGVGNAPRAIRADKLAPQGARLRYVNCPFAPFIGTDDQNVCEGK